LGNSPAGIPYSVSSHSASTSSMYHSVTSSASNTSVNSSAIMVAPTACTPSFTVHSYVTVGTTFSLINITPTTSGDTFTAGSAIFGCTTTGWSGAGSPDTCSATASAQLAAGTPFTLSTAAIAGPQAFVLA